MPFVDTDVLVGLIKPNDPFHQAAIKVILMPDLYTSSLALLELALVTRREISESLSLQLPQVLNFKGKIIPFTPENFKASNELRRKYNLGIFDSAHAAAALHGDKIIISSDTAFDLVQGLKIIPLERV